MKTTLRTLLAALAAFVIAFHATPAHADTTPDGLVYTVNSGTAVTITAYSGTGGAVSIPPTINVSGTDLPVTSIGDDAFYYCVSLTNVTISDGVTRIGGYAFYGCTGLTSATIPGSVTIIGFRAFQGCTGLTSVTIPNSVTFIGGYAFCFCTGLTNVTIPGSVTIIGNGAFWGCTGLTSVTIPDSVTSIGDGAFSDCTGLLFVSIGNGVTSIGFEAFIGCYRLTSVTIPSSVTSIGDWAFYGCTGLTSATIPGSVTSIGVWAFRECTGLTSVTIPGSVTSIGDDAFSYCTSLKVAFFTGNAPTLGSSVFDSTASGFKVYYLNGATGFASPMWLGYPTVKMGAYPTAVTVALLGPNPLTFEATSNGIFFDSWGATAMDDPANPLTPVVTANNVVANVPGTYSVTWSATDFLGLTGSATRVVNVVDTTAPVVTPPPNVIAEATGSNGATVSYPPATALDAVGVTSLTYSQDSGTVFPIGTTTVTVTARDAALNIGTATFTVTVTPASAAKGDTADGIPGATFASFGNPAMNNSDHMAFGAKVSGSGVSSSNNLGIWADDYTGTRQLVIRTGTYNVPGLIGAVFKKFSDPVYSGSNAVAFIGTLTQGFHGVDTTNDTGVWSNDGGTLHLVAQEGSRAPTGFPMDGETYFSQFKQIALPDQGGVVMLAKVRGTGIRAANDMGILAGSGSTQQLVVREGGLIPGTSGTVKTLTFLPAAANVTGQTRCFDSAGDLLYSVKFTSGTTAIYKATLSSGTYTHTSVATQGDAATGIAGAKFASFGNPTMNELGQVAFAAKLSGSVSSSSNVGIWADGTNGVRQIVVRSGTTAPDAAGTGSVGVFKKFSDPVYSGSSAVAFLGTLVQGGGVTVSNDTGVWSNDGGTLHLVAREGVQAPGCAAGVTFKTFTQIALPDQGGVVMFAKLGGTGVGSSNDMAIFAVDTGGTLQLIAREGTTHAVTGKTIKTLSFLPCVTGVSGQTRGFSQSTGDLVYSATFLDGSAGIFKVVFP